MLDLDLVTAELQSRVEKYQVETRDLHQSLRSLSLSSQRRSPGVLYDLVRRDQNSSFHLVTTELHQHNFYTLRPRMKDLEGLEIEGDRVLEVGGLEVLTVSQEDWTNLQPHLRFPLPVLALREQRNTPGPNISLKADFDLSKIQRRLERKLAESAAATSQLRLRTRENRDLLQNCSVLLILHNHNNK